MGWCGAVIAWFQHLQPLISLNYVTLCPLLPGAKPLLLQPLRPLLDCHLTFGARSGWFRGCPRDWMGEVLT